MDHLAFLKPISIALFLCLGSGYGSPGEKDIVAVLFGFGGGDAFYSSNEDGNRRGDMKFEVSVYGMDRKQYLFMERGYSVGAELGPLNFRPYFQIDELLVGLHTPGRFPIAYIGVSGEAVGELTKHKRFYSDLGVGASVWIGTVLGTVEVTQRFMVFEFMQTRLDYTFKIPFFTCAPYRPPRQAGSPDPGL